MAFEYVNDAVENLIGWTAAEAKADAGAVLAVVDAPHTAQLTAALELSPGTEATVEETISQSLDQCRERH
ncbi:hypothetical protein MHPYR_50132 [uncultured Mycobacterium sp.]|uniref:Uncharacterized protein n=1 Tax=uncultured Mycobacterium sp. TaxID=171292 RepID=A0A1Y5PGX8_9MYCO|nr:hypothetical protein MHPYR_50132 [uncultured Mycobacterium sp.]